MISWTLLICISLTWNSWQSWQSMLNQGKSEGRMAFLKDLSYRVWNASHGGVYVQITEDTKPNPYLRVPHRDITTTTGKELTLINPAFMTREVLTMSAKIYGLKGHITSLNLLNPRNKHDDWEKEALQSFELQPSEVTKFMSIEGQPFMRFMRPMITTKACLKCHDSQGYKVGDVRGGISVSVPMAHHLAAAKKAIWYLALAHLVFWIVGLAGLAFSKKKIIYYFLVSEKARKLEETEKAQLKVSLNKLLQAESRIQELNEGLELKVSERTKELKVANERLKSLDQLKSMFIASMSHELRTPLNSIIGFTGMIVSDMAGPISDLQRDYLQRAHSAGKHLLDLITDVIDISKIEAGKIAVSYKEFLLDEVVNEALDSVENDLYKKELKLETDISTGIVMYTDRKRLLQCLLNLLSNAIKYSVQGTIRVEIKPHNKQVEFLISDTGIGISEQDQKRLFEPFVRFESPLKMHTAGTGLGLYLTRKLAQDVLAGTVSATSQIDHGSTFSLNIPQRIASENNNVDKGSTS